MSNKTLLIMKRIAVILAIIILCSSSAASALAFREESSKSSGFLSGLLERIKNIGKYEGKYEGKYDLKALQKDLEDMKNSGNADINKITELIEKLPKGEEKDILMGIKDLFTKFPSIGEGNIVISILNKLLETIKSILGGILGSSSELPKPETIDIESKTATEFAGEDYKVKLHANVYKNGNSDKWAVLVHPFMLKGQTIANKVGPYYYEKGYNIIAPDLRSFGESEGKVALGFLESLDVYDWLNLINEKYDVNKVIVHGISLGGATTNFLSGIDQFIKNGPTKINTQLKSLRELNVIGLVEDCGYTDMTQFASKTMLVGMNIGLTESNFDYYSKATNSLKYCDIPMLIIHGTGDTTVKPENADTVKNTVKGPVEQWLVDGAAHAFAIMGMKADEYKAHVQDFIDKYDTTDTTVRPPEVDIEDDKPVVEEEKSFIKRLLDMFKSKR